MKALTLCTLAAMLAANANAQVLERSLLASAGNQVQAGNIRLEQSVGDLVVTTASAGGITLTQGFEQNDDQATGIASLSPSELLFYPNPTRDFITIQWPAGTSGTAQVQVLDLLGQVLWEEETLLSAPTFVDLRERATGTYFIRVIPAAGNSSVIKVQKTG